LEEGGYLKVLLIKINFYGSLYLLQKLAYAKQAHSIFAGNLQLFLKLCSRL